MSVAKDAILVLIRRLSKLEVSLERETLLEKAKKQLSEVDAWELSSGSERRNDLMKRTLELHFEVVSLERSHAKGRS